MDYKNNRKLYLLNPLLKSYQRFTGQLFALGKVVIPITFFIVNVYRLPDKLICCLLVFIVFASSPAHSQQTIMLKAGHSNIDLSQLPLAKSRQTEFRPIQKSSASTHSNRHLTINKKFQATSTDSVDLLSNDFIQPGMSPALRYTGRSALDPLGTLKSNEITLIQSQFSQRGIDRWGDYSAMTLDPDDDCTFWYTGLYVGSEKSTKLSIGTWSTRIASFKFPECGGMFDLPVHNIAGIDFTGSYPADPVGDVGMNYYIQMANAPTGAVFSIFTKQDGSHIAGPIELASLWQGDGACKDGRGDPIVIWDQFANRWLMMELGRNLRSLCVYLSANEDPMSGGWYTYQVDTPNFPDYPKMAVYSDAIKNGAYIITTNEAEPAVYVLDREDMLSGNNAAVKRLEIPRLPGFAFQALTPADVEGKKALKPGTPAYLVRHFDDELHAPENALENYDFLEIWSIDLGFKTKSEVRISGISRIPIEDFESELCGTVSTGCFGQATTGTTLDPLFEVAMWRVTIRNLGEQQVLLGNFTVDANGKDQGGIRWFDLRKQGRGIWNLHQQGTLAPDNANRWMGSIAMDAYENIAIGYSVSAADPPILDQNESNDDFTTASFIACGTHNTAATITTEDVDYYLLEGDPGLAASINIDAAVDNSSLNSLLGVFDSDFQLLQFNDNGLAAEESLLSEDSYLLQTIPEDGRLYIAVTSSGDNSFNGQNGRSTGFYKLSTECTETRVDSFEPNNSFQTAAEVTCPIETVDTGIDTSFDFDYFRFTSLNPAQTVEFSVDTSLSSNSIELQLRAFNSSGQLISISETDETSQEDPSLSLQVPNDGILFALIAASDLTSTGEYLLNCIQ